MYTESKRTVFSQRLREARESTGLSQRRVGILAGLDPSVASTRINRYEQATSWPDLGIMLKIAGVLGVPAPLFIAEDNRLAEAIKLFGAASKRKQNEVLKVLRGKPSRSTRAGASGAT